MTGAALGCSHTAGTGINPSDCYVSVLSRMIGHYRHLQYLLLL